jgi:hypothetical protein
LTRLADGAAVFEAASDAFERARAAAGEQLHEVRRIVAGVPVTLRVAGRDLFETFEPPLSHLAATEPPARASHPLRIDLWDQAATGIRAPLPPLPDGLGPYGLACASEDGRYVADIRAQSGAVLDRAAGRIVGSALAADRLYLDERARPLHRLLSVWLAGAGIQFVHAGLVARDERGVLLTGAGGSGKSTTSILCLRHGFQFLGDDFVGLEMSAQGGAVGHSLYGTSLVGLDHLRRFPEFEVHAQAPHHAGEDKSLILLSRLYGDRMVRHARIRAIVLVRVVDRDRTFSRPASKSEAMLWLAPSSLMLMTGAGPRAIDVLARLVERTPCRWLELGRDMESIPDRVADVLIEAA